jgi:hypothetical protein
MSYSLNCPFCHNVLARSNGFVNNEEIFLNYDHYYCENSSCIVDDMPRYQINYTRGITSTPSSCAFMIGTYYVQVDFQNNTTTLSTLHSIILLDSITLPRALHFNMDDLASVEERIKTLLTFS